MRKEQRATKRGRTMSTRRTSKEEEDDNNDKEEDCAAAAAAATTAAATTAATTGLHASSAATASDQAVAAVAAAWRSGLRRGAVAASADSRMPSLTPAFFVFLSKCSLHVAQNTMFHGSFPPDSGRIPGSGGFRNKLILPWNDLIPTCVQQNL
jgi:hypothetical protein